MNQQEQEAQALAALLLETFYLQALSVTAGVLLKKYPSIQRIRLARMMSSSLWTQSVGTDHMLSIIMQMENQQRKEQESEAQEK